MSYSQCQRTPFQTKPIPIGLWWQAQTRASSWDTLPLTQLRSTLIDHNLALRSGVAKGRVSYQMDLAMAVLDDGGVAPCS